MNAVLSDATRNRLIEYRVWTPVNGNEKHPLVLLSHGSGGEFSNHNWLIESLVENGYVVAAANHPFNTTGDNTNAGIISVWDRPADMSRLLDSVLADQTWSIDENRIGAAGFSSGGYTVLALAGAEYDQALLSDYCISDDHGPDCDLAGPATGVDFSNSSLSYRDERVKAVFAMAPAVGAAITEASLESIRVPVFIIAASDDELVYPTYNAIRYHKHIASSSLELLPGGGHFIFLQCNFVIRIVDWFNEDLDLCGRAFEVDRARVRQSVAAKAIDFFSGSLGFGSEAVELN